MEELKKNPYSNMKSAQALEESEDIRGAEKEYKKAVSSADTLPLDEYKTSLQHELQRYKDDPKYEVKPGIGERELWKAFSEVLALPFITRVELASFYARNGCYEEAQEVIDQAFDVRPDEVVLLDPRVMEIHGRAALMQQTLHDMIGPEEIERLFADHFARLDRDNNGFIHHRELEQAQFDLSLPPECQHLIRHLLCHYFEVESSHDDEWGWGIDINGISRRDIIAYAKKRKATWKRATKESRAEGDDHVW